MITLGTLGPRPLEIVGVADPLETLIRHVSSSVALRQTVSTYTRSQHLGTASLDGAWFPFKYAPPGPRTLPCQMFILSQTVRVYGYPLENFDPPFKVTQGHWNRHGTIGCLGLISDGHWHYLVPFPK